MNSNMFKEVELKQLIWGGVREVDIDGGGEGGEIDTEIDMEGGGQDKSDMIWKPGVGTLAQPYISVSQEGYQSTPHR